jgi:G:T-mismatch repair DNA endonuclease (very short patch repair protein)
MPAVQPDVKEEHWATQVYEALVLRGVDPHDMTPNYEDEDGTRVILAMPESKVALATDGDVYESLLDAGWQVTVVPVGAMKSFASTARELNSVTTNYRVRSSGSQMLKTGSEDEARMLNGILRAHLPPPDRNFRIMREDSPGKELTVPDFAWPRHRVAFFLDGLWWHHGRDSDVQKKALLGTADKAVLEEVERQQSARATRDANNRSELTLMGWMVLSCSDEDVADESGVARQVERIKKALRSAAERASQAGQGRSAEGDAAPGGADDVEQSLDEIFGNDVGGTGYSQPKTHESESASSITTQEGGRRDGIQQDHNGNAPAAREGLQGEQK